MHVRTSAPPLLASNPCTVTTAREGAALSISKALEAQAFAPKRPRADDSVDTSPHAALLLDPLALAAALTTVPSPPNTVALLVHVLGESVGFALSGLI